MRLSIFNRFSSERSGSVAIIFGIAMIPIALLAGGTVDASMAYAHRSRLQVALDNTVLAMAREPETTSDEEFEARASTLFASQFADGIHNSESIVDIVRTRGHVTASAEAAVPTAFLGIIGMTEFEIAAHAEVSWGIGHLEVALALDNTGSMADYGRMAALKEASLELLTVLEAGDYEDGAVKVGIVPFDTHVRMPVPTPPTSYSWVRHTSATSSNWPGYITDRDSPYDTLDTAATSSSTRYPAAGKRYNRVVIWGIPIQLPIADLAFVHPLSDDFDSLRTRIGQMQPAGNTNTTIGMAWGTAMLSPRAPLTEGADFGTANLQKIIVMITDGENTQNRFAEDAAAIDARTRQACQEARDQGIVVYTIRLMEGSTDLIRDCATSPSHFYNVEDVDDLLPAFQSIAEEISRIRISS